MTRDSIASDVRVNLDDAGVTFYTDTDLNDSIQDGYDDIAVISGCIQKTASLSWQDQLSYYDFSTLISDFYAVVAIYNNNTNRFLDPIDTRKLDAIRDDWEIWTGEPQFFVPINYRYTAIVPRPTTASGTYVVYYRAKAPTLSGSTVPLIHTDDQQILELYSTADMLDQMQEYTKADKWWERYFVDVLKYKNRVHNLALSDYIPILGSQ